MNELRKVARAYYDRAKEEEKELARQFFQSLDPNAVGKVSLTDYKKLVDPFFSNDEIFRHLDENGDGNLDFDEVLALYYMNKVSIPRCRACHDMLLSSYFSCLPCLGKSSYYLCCNCYGGGKFKHDHPSNEFADTRALLNLLDQLMGKAKVATNQLDTPQEVQNDDDTDGKAKSKNSSRSTRAQNKDEVQNDDDTDGKTKSKSSSRSTWAQNKAEAATVAMEALNVGLSLGSTVVSIGAMGVAASAGCCIM